MSRPSNDFLLGIQKPLKKLYYSLRQAAEMLDMSPEAIKRWEADFPEIKPTRNRADNRYYTIKDVYLLLFIKERLLDHHQSVDAGREAIPAHRGELLEREQLQLKQTLAEILLEIREIMDLLNAGGVSGEVK